MTLEKLLPNEDYGFRLRFDQGSVADFFQASKQHEALIAQRRHWLESAPAACVALLPEGVPLLDETICLAHSIGALPPGIPVPSSPALSSSEQLLKMGVLWEPDFLLLRPGLDGRLRLMAGCVCFPSSWSLEEKIGRPLEDIHSVVPGLNTSIGPQIHRFLAKLRPNVGWLRGNWGLSRSPELNQHPSHNLPRLDETIHVDEVWVRIEHQLLAALPDSSGVLFGIRILTQPLREVRSDPTLSSRLLRALQTMPEPVAVYKGLAKARPRLISLLQEKGL
jgi:hypothetical protein